MRAEHFQSMHGALPDNARELAELMAERLGVVVGTIRVTLIFHDGRYVDGYQQPASARLNPKALEQLPIELLERIRTTR